MLTRTFPFRNLTLTVEDPADPAQIIFLTKQKFKDSWVECSGTWSQGVTCDDSSYKADVDSEGTSMLPSRCYVLRRKQTVAFFHHGMDADFQ